MTESKQEQWHPKIRRRPTAERAAHIYAALDYALERGHSVERGVLWAGMWALTKPPSVIQPYDGLLWNENGPYGRQPPEGTYPKCPYVLRRLMFQEGHTNSPYLGPREGRHNWGGFKWETHNYPATNARNCKEAFRRHWPLMLAALAKEYRLVEDTPDIILAAYLGEELGLEELQLRILRVSEYLESDRLLPPERLAGAKVKMRVNRDA